MRTITLLDAAFTAHPRAIGENYLTHAGHAARFGLTMIAAGTACLVHALIPGLFVTTGSETVRRLHARMAARVGRSRETDQHFCYEI